MTPADPSRTRRHLHAGSRYHPFHLPSVRRVALVTCSHGRSSLRGPERVRDRRHRECCPARLIGLRQDVAIACPRFRHSMAGLNRRRKAWGAHDNRKVHQRVCSLGGHFRGRINGPRAVRGCWTAMSIFSRIPARTGSRSSPSAKGEFFGEMAVIDGSSRSATAGSRRIRRPRDADQSRPVRLSRQPATGFPH